MTYTQMIIAAMLVEDETVREQMIAEAEKMAGSSAPTGLGEQEIPWQFYIPTEVKDERLR